MASASFSGGSTRRHDRRVIWIGVWTLLLSLLAPVISLQAADAAAAQVDQQECDEGLVLDEQSGECVPEEDGQPADLQRQDQQQECQPGQTLDSGTGQCVPAGPPDCPDGTTLNPVSNECLPNQPEEQPSGVQMEKFNCPPGADWYQASYQELDAGCPANQQPVTFTHTDPQGQNSVDQVTSGFEWSPTDAGYHTITEQIPEGYGEPIVWCSSYVPRQSNPVLNPTEIQNEASVGWQLDPNEWLYCKWFNIPTDGGGTIIIHKFKCETAEAFEPDVADYQGFRQYCQDPMPGVPFELWLDDQQPKETTATDQQGQVTFEGVPGGPLTIVEQVPDGYQVGAVFCLAYPANQKDSLSPTKQEIQEGSFIGWNLEDGYVLECFWYNIPAQHAKITVTKYWCPPELSLGQSPTAQDWTNACQESGPEGTVLSLSGPDDYLQTSTIVGLSASEHTWGELEPGGYTLTEIFPEGTSYELTVFCHIAPLSQSDNGNGNGLLAIEQWEVVNGNSIEWTAEPGFHWICAILNVPVEDGGNSVTVYKWECQPGTEYGQDQGYYQGEDQDVGPCESEHLNIPISLVDANGEHPTTTQANGTQWNDVTIGQEGELQLIEEIPAGYGDPVVFCWTGDGDPVLVPSANGFVIPTPDVQEEPWHYFCNWYNIPTTGGSTNTLQKYSCDPGTSRDSDPSDLAQNCAPHGGVTFTLQYGDASVPDTTDDQGNASWSGVPVGPWSIQEDIPDGYGEPLVYCLYTDWPAGVADADESSRLIDSPDGIFQGAFKYDNMQVFCGVFNFELDTNWLDITKWWCTEDVTTPYEQSADNLLESCERYTDGVDFTLEYGQQSVPMTTDGDGNAEWSGIPAGQWAIHETIPDDYGDPVVYCRWIEWPEGVEIGTDPFKVQSPAGSFTGDFKYGGMRLHCDIFNIPDYDPGQITLYKWYCPEGVPRDSDPDYLRENCDYVTTGVSFNLVLGEVSMPVTTDSSGKAEWPNVPTGNWILAEAPDQGYDFPVIYCQYVAWPDDADVDGEMFTPETTDYSIRGAFEHPGLHLVCYWFNFPHDNGDSGITIYKYLCPPASSYPDDLDAYLEGCGDTPMDGASFTLTNDAGAYPGVTAGGKVEWTGLPDGSFEAQEALPEGYSPPKVWCYRYQYESNGEQPAIGSQDYEQVDAGEGVWSGSIEDGPIRIICHWFNIPGEDNTVTVYKYNCEYKPVGFHSLGEWLDACPTKGDGVGFTLDTSNGPQAQETVDGKATWADVPVEPFTITEEPQAGYGEPVVWCGWTAYYNGEVNDAFPQLVEASGGVYHGTISVPNTSYVCFWFNIPEEDSRIVVYKYYCPEGALDGVVPDELTYYQTTCTEEGNGIEFTLENSQGTTSQDIMNGSATWNDVPQGPFTLTETIPPGYGEPVWWCGFTGYENGAIADGFPMQVEAPGGVFSASINFDVTNYFCWVFNFPDRDRTVTVHKWYCPEGTQPDTGTFDAWKSTCIEPMSSVGFTHEDSSGSTWKLTGISGSATWYGAEPGENSLTEQHLPGYFPPVVYCELDARYDDGAAYAEGLTPYDVTDDSVSKALDYAEFHWICHFFNIPEGPGEITIYKWYCPPGYDVNAWNADPTVDCTQAQNGIPFTLDQPVGPNLMSNTGDSIPGAVYFGDLDPGGYVVSETVPADVGYVFVWDCVGTDIPKVHPMPLNWGSVLNVDVAGGDSIICHWYNVPDPEFGWITLYKYSCSTETFMSEVDCQVYEFGASFELFQVDGNASKGVGDTNAGGQYTWNNLEEGAYSLDEISHEPCKITSTKVDGEGNAWVDAGQGTVIKVYNCKVDTSTTPEVPGKVPGKYPNTGVGPAGDMLFPSMQQTPEPDETPIVGVDGTPVDPIEAAEQFYEISCLNEDAADGTPVAFVDEDTSEEGLPPFLQAPDDAEPTAESTAGAEGTPPADEECLRGAVPEKLVINAANVNHDVEVLEIVDGVMQPPTGPNVVSWYKETARLGESNNLVIAGHLNWWNVPEGPFFALDTLEEGDRIEVTGEDGMIYVYEVQWVRQESNLAAPDPEVVGPTDEPSLTLITCGGEWDAAIAEYNARTVARAVQVDVIAAEEDPDASDEAAMLLAA